MATNMESTAKGQPRLRAQTREASAPKSSKKAQKAPVEGPALMVLGMHRSGTSATTRVCNLLGIELGSNLMQAQPDNEEGYWEHQDVYIAHEELLAGIGSAWDDYRALPEDWLKSSAVTNCRKRIKSILKSEFADNRFWGIKDPRVCRLVPLWLPVLKALGRTPHFLLVCRNPLEVAASLANRDSFHAAKSQLLWLRHLIDAERDTRGYPRTFLMYENLLQDWRRTMSRAASALGISWPRDASKAGDEIDQFLKVQLRHQGVDDIVIESDRRLSRWIRDSYRVLKKAADGDEAPLGLVLTEIASELEAAAPILEPWVRGLELDLSKAGNQLDEQSRVASAQLSEMEGLRDELDSIAANLADRQKDIAWLNDEVEGRQSEIERLSGGLEEAKANLADRQKDIAWLNDEVAGRQKEIDRLERELSEAKTNLVGRQKDIAWLNEEVSGREKEIDRLSAELSDAKVNLSDRQKDISWLNKEVSGRQKQIDRLSGELSDAKVNLADRQKDISWLNDQVANRQSEIERRDVELTEAKANLADREKDIAWLNEQVAARQGTIDLMSGQLEMARSRATEQDNQIGRLEEKAARQADEVASLTERLHAADRELASQRQEREALLAERDAILMSTSWQVTAPLRGVRRLVDRLPKIVAARGNIAAVSRSERHTRVIAESRLFNPEFYLSSNPDVAQSGADPLAHYVEHGAAEGRAPNPFFNGSWYLEQNPDVADKGMNPLVHYLECGWSEGRRPNPLFDPKKYLSLHTDIRDAGVEPLSHFIEYGALEGRIGWTQDDVLRVQSPYIEQPEEAARIASLRALDHLDLRLEPGARVGVFTSSEGNYFFDEIRDIILQALCEAGLQALPLRESAPLDGSLDARIVIAPHEFFVLGKGPELLTTDLPERSVILNTEQWGTQWFVRSLPALVRAKAVLDMNLQSAASLTLQGIPAAFLPIGYVESDTTLGPQSELPDLQALQSLPEHLRRYQPTDEGRIEDRPIDVFFVGSLGPRRDRILAQLSPTLAPFHCFLFLPSPHRPFVQGKNAKLNTAAVCGLSQRSKVLLNLHQSEASYFEWQRIVMHGFWQQTLVLSEPCYRIPGIEPGEHYIEAEAEQMPAVLDQLLNNAEGRERADSIRRKGHAVLRERFVLSSLFKELFRLD